MIYLIIGLTIWALLERKARFRILKKHGVRIRQMSAINRSLSEENIELSCAKVKYRRLEALFELVKKEVIK